MKCSLEFSSNIKSVKKSDVLGWFHYEVTKMCNNPNSNNPLKENQMAILFYNLWQCFWFKKNIFWRSVFHTKQQVFICRTNVQKLVISQRFMNCQGNHSLAVV